MSSISINVCLTVGAWLHDEGLYICEAKNQFGSIKAEARVSVTGLGKLIVAPLWPNDPHFPSCD